MKVLPAGNEEHHCSLIEKELVSAELLACDEDYTDEKERKMCYLEVKSRSLKREHHCMVT